MSDDSNYYLFTIIHSYTLARYSLSVHVFGYNIIILTGEWNLQRRALFSSMSEHNLDIIIWFRPLLGRISIYLLP